MAYRACANRPIRSEGQSEVVVRVGYAEGHAGTAGIKGRPGVRATEGGLYRLSQLHCNTLVTWE